MIIGGKSNVISNLIQGIINVSWMVFKRRFPSQKNWVWSPDRLDNYTGLVDGHSNHLSYPLPPTNSETIKISEDTVLVRLQPRASTNILGNFPLSLTALITFNQNKG